MQQDIFSFILVALVALMFVVGMLGCAAKTPTMPRIEFSCISYAVGDRLMSDCADPKTWAEWMAKQAGGI